MDTNRIKKVFIVKSQKKKKSIKDKKSSFSEYFRSNNYLVCDSDG